MIYLLNFDKCAHSARKFWNFMGKCLVKWSEKGRHWVSTWGAPLSSTKFLFAVLYSYTLVFLIFLPCLFWYPFLYAPFRCPLFPTLFISFCLLIPLQFLCFIFLRVFLITIFFLFSLECSRFFYPLVAPYSFLFHFVEYLGAPFLSSYFLSLPLFSKSFHCHPWVATLILSLFHFSFAFVSFSFPSPPFSLFPFLFRPSSFAPPFLSFFSLLYFLLSFAPLLFGAPLRPPGGTCPYAPQDTPLKTFQLLVTAGWKKEANLSPYSGHTILWVPPKA